MFAQPYVATPVAPDRHAGGLPVIPAGTNPGPNPGVGSNPGPNPSPPGPPAGASQADLAARGIRVRSAEPGGGDDCNPGKNDVTVVIKNDGTAASGFAVRRVVDGADDQAKEQSVAGLDAGKELEVRFDDVRLRRGMRELRATVDAKKAVAESDEDNNELKITVNCRDEG